MNRITVKNVFLAIAATFALSFLAHIHPWLHPFLFLLSSFLFTVLAFRRIGDGFSVLFASLFVDSFGYVFAWRGISLRIVMAGVLMALVGIRLLRRISSQSTAVNQESKTSPLSPPLTREERGRRLLAWVRIMRGPDRTRGIVYGLFISWLFFSFVLGWARNGLQNAFQDFNGFLFLLFVPAIAVLPALERGGSDPGPRGADAKPAPPESVRISVIVTILKAALLWQFFLVSVLEFLFSRWGTVPVLYTFIRDNRFGEITPVFGNFYRVFLQSEIYAIVGLLLAFVGILYSNHRLSLRVPASDVAGEAVPFRSIQRDCFAPRKMRGPRNDILESYGLLFISTVILLISLSRSFWLGTGVALIIFVMVSVSNHFLGSWKSSDLLRLTIKKVFVVGVMFTLSMVYVAFISNTGIGTSQVVKDRVDVSEPAASSRSAQLGPLHSAILQSPLIGYGFGKELEYRSSDPRRVESSGGTGIVKTWAFELGWHDLTLKTGFIGTTLYFSFIILVMTLLWSRLRSQAEGIRQEVSPFPSFPLSLFLSLCALIVIHAFTPYLNHPLGIGALMAATVVIQNHESREL